MRLRLRGFGAYRPSEIRWFSGIPVQWQLKRLRHVSTCLDGRRIPLNAEERADIPGDYPYWGANQVIDKVGRWLFDEPLVLLGEDGAPFFDQRRPVAFHVRGKIWVNNHAHVLRPRGIEPEYLAHILNLTDYEGFIDGSTRDKLTQRSMQDIPVLCPPLDEQRYIVRFLGHASRKVNRLIRAKRRMIELLNEQKQAIINRAATRGLDPDARLKPSGIEWLGDVPEHWEILRTRYVLREVDVRSTTGAETHLSMSQRLGLVPNAAMDERRLISESYVGGKLCEPGDLVLNRLKAHLGVFALAGEAGLVSADYTVLRFRRRASERFFEAVLRTPACRVELRKRTKGIVQGFWRLYTDDLYDIALPVPPVDEQTRIMNALDAELSNANSAIDKASREIELIREYRTRLIADVVTGKLDVRGVDLPPIEDEEPLDESELAVEAEEPFEEEPGEGD